MSGRWALLARETCSCLRPGRCALVIVPLLLPPFLFLPLLFGLVAAGFPLTMPSAIAGSAPAVLKGAWRPTKIMNMQDLSRDDDFLSHLLVEKLGTGGFPLVVHKMDPSRRLPKTDPEDLMKIVRRVSASLHPCLV